MINAAEAREKSMQIKKSLHSEEMKRIEMCINAAVAKGERQCTVWSYISKENEEKLKDLGFSVKRFCQYQEDETFIEW